MRFPINVNNVIGRHKKPFRSSGFKFPTVTEVQEIVADVSQSFSERNKLIDRYFPEDSSFSGTLEMYLLRTQGRDDKGMTLVHQIGANVWPTETRTQKVDLFKMSMSPLAFKESKVWEEKEMLYLGQLTAEVQSSEINATVEDFIAWTMVRMQNRREWLIWQILRTGKVVIDSSDPYNPNGLHYDIDYGVTDMVLPITNKFDAKDGNGKSLTDPIQYFLDLKKAAQFKPEIMPVRLIVNSAFVDILADNTHIQLLLDYERGLTSIEMRPPRAVYKAGALELFTRYTGLTVEIYDGLYEDDNGDLHYWIPNGEMVVICQNDSAMGNFVYTAHVAGTDAQGNVTFGTGPFLHVDDKTKQHPPFYGITAGFHGAPQIKGYSPKDRSFHRIKWLNYASAATAASHLPTYPEKVVLGEEMNP